MASVILGTLGTLCVAIAKFVPRRSNSITDREFQALQTRVDIGFSAVQSTLVEVKRELRELRDDRK